jgi:hypothetical protein
MTTGNTQKLAMEEIRRAEQQAEVLRLQIKLQGLKAITWAFILADAVIPHLLR